MNAWIYLPLVIVTFRSYILYKFVLSKKNQKYLTKKMERGKDSIDLDYKPLSKSNMLLNIKKLHD